jgi:hypothetical protein
MDMGKLNQEFGVDAKNNISNLNQRSMDGAVAGLESFYYGFNNKDLDALKKVWYNDGHIQLNNPVGGIVRGIDAIMKLYDKIFNSQTSVWVRLTDIVYYATGNMVVFAGTEVGEFVTNGETIALKIRTSRVFGYLDHEKSWFQLHHHGSIDNPDLLSSYQAAVGNAAPHS